LLANWIFTSLISLSSPANKMHAISLACVLYLFYEQHNWQ
jgi:hypothetical protein